MDYPCAKFGDFSFSHFGVFLSCGHRQRITDADDRYAHTTTVGMNNNIQNCMVISQCFLE